jgi:hypothetical protein
VRVPKSWVGGRAVRVGDGRCWKGKEKRRRDRNGGKGSKEEEEVEATDGSRSWVNLTLVKQLVYSVEFTCRYIILKLVFGISNSSC